jgi:hypothetical protein
MTANQEITDFTPYQQAITVWQAEKDRVAAERAAAEAMVIGEQPNVIAE